MISPALDPDPRRALACDAQWRARLRPSFDYLREVTQARGADPQDRLAAVRDRVAAGPVSPWVSCLYSKLVAELSRKDRPPVEATLQNLEEASARPASEAAPVTLGDAAVPPDWWDQFAVLMDTDRALPFRPRAASAADAEACLAEIAAGLDLLARADPGFAAEFPALARVVVLGAPESPEPRDDFGACSTFFLRETVLVNAARRRSPVRMIDLLVHEASHILLFGLAMNQPLTTDRGEIRLKSAAREDPRPIDGIFHAAFVASRVHLAMERMIASGRLTAGEAEEAAERRDRNGAVARESVATVAEHAPLTETGAGVLAALTDYWASRPALATA